MPITPEAQFVPKSTKFLERGHFWAIPLANGKFGAGCVVGQHMHEGKPHSRIFIAGVIAWHGNAQPLASQLFGRGIYAHAFAHIKAITSSGGSILGKAHLQFGDLPSRSESLTLTTWGYGVPPILAAKFVAANS